MTGRKTLDQMTSDDLDELHAGLARAEAALARVPAEPNRADQLDTVTDDDGRADAFSTGARWTLRMIREALDGTAPGPATETDTEAGLREQYRTALTRFIDPDDDCMPTLSEDGKGFTWVPADTILDSLMRIRDRRMEQLAAGRHTWKRKAEEIEADRDQRAATLDRVRRLHRPVGIVAAAEHGEPPDCATCRHDWPCQTYDAITEAAAQATEPAATPSRRAGLRAEIANALEAADYRHDMRRGDLADAILPVLYREWPWLRAEAEDAEQQHDQHAATLDQVRAPRDDLKGITGARWIAEALDKILDPPKEQQ